MSRYAKSIVAFLAAAATWCTTALDDDRISNAEWAGLAAAVLGVLAVYQVRNTPDAGGDDSGHAELGTLVPLMVLGILVLVVCLSLGWLPR